MNMILGDISLPLWLVVSQWTLLFALGFLIIVMYRQVGYLQQIRNRGSEREGLATGEQAPAFDYTPVNEGAKASTRFEPSGRWSLLIFADPTCVSCQSTLLALERIAPKLDQAVRVLVATTADPAQIAAVDAFQTETVAISRVRNDVPSRLYRTNITPFGYVIDAEGKIRARDVPADEAAIRKMLRKVEQSVYAGSTVS